MSGTSAVARAMISSTSSEGYVRMVASLHASPHLVGRVLALVQVHADLQQAELARLVVAAPKQTCSLCK